MIDFAHTRKDGARFIDLQRLEENVVAEILADEMQKQELSTTLLSDIIQALHEEVHPDKLSADITSLKKPYWLLYTIRQLANKYQPKTTNWEQYYPGLYLTFIGGLKYKERDNYQCTLSLVGAATVLKYIDWARPATITSSTFPSQLPNPQRRTPMKSLILLLLGFVIAVGLFFVALFTRVIIVGPLNTPTPTTTGFPENTQTPLPAFITVTMPVTTYVTVTNVITVTPPPPETTLARVNRKGYIRCGIPRNTPGFGIIDTNQPSVRENLDPKDQGVEFYDEAGGLEAGLCKAIAAAIFGLHTGHVKFLALETNSDNGQQERFTAIRDDIVDVGFRNTTATETRENKEGIDFLQVYYIDTAAFMYDEEVIREKLGNNEDIDLKPATKTEMYALLKQLNISICVQGKTTTRLEIEKNLGLELINPKSDFTTDTLWTAYINGNCSIIAIDRGQIAALQKKNKYYEGTIIPITQTMITVEPLAPFVKENDSQWRDLLNAVIRTTMYADQMGITKEMVEEFAKLNVSTNDKEVVIQRLVHNNKNTHRKEYEDFFGLGTNNIPTPIDVLLNSHLNGPVINFRARVISQVGGYTDIFYEAFGVPPSAPNIMVPNN